MSDCCKTKEKKVVPMKRKEQGSNAYALIALGVVLALLIVSGVQAIQISNLKQNVATYEGTPTTQPSTTQSAPAPQPAQQPPAMVGGC